MQKMLLAAGLALLWPLAISAQESPKAELFGGYSYLRADAGGEGVNLNGWNASIAVNPNRWFGLVADFSGHYGSPFDVDTSVHSFLFGPRVSYRKHGTVTPFAHALFGATHIKVTTNVAGAKLTESDTAFALALGGGIDVKLRPSVALRLIQADYLLTRFGEETQNNVRLSTGFVFRWGNR